MPTLDWIGKKAVENHHRKVPYHLLRCDSELSVGDPGSGNLLVQGDNLLALKALLPYYAGQVKCIYIDPPYNTGNEKWVYNDAVNSQEMRDWLGKVVGSEAEDLSRHDKWLCMMYPRLQLLRQFLKPDGIIFVSIGTDEQGHLRLLLDELFGSRNRIAVAAWETAYTANQTAKHISETTDFVFVYANNFDKAVVGKFGRSEEQLAKFKNPDNDRRGPWKAENLSAGRFYAAGQFEIVGPTGKKFLPPPGRFWRCNEAQFKDWLSEGRITFGKAGSGRPMLKNYRDELSQGLTPTTWWKHEDFATAKDASIELKAIFGGQATFATPKPVRLMERILQIATNPGDIVLDSFAGSGTTGHAVLELNKADGGNRRFILVEMEEDICRNVTAQRLSRVTEGYTTTKTNGSKEEIPGLGGGFRYCTLGAPLFDATGGIGGEVRFADLSAHVFFTETGEPLPKRKNGSTPLLGSHNGTAIYLLYNGILKDKSANGGNALTRAVLAELPPHDGPKVIYGTSCRLGSKRLRDERITFRQIPYEVRVR